MPIKHVKVNDKVVILTGKDNGKTGQVIAIDHQKRRVKVERRNMVVKHRKPNRILNIEGARVEQENWLDASNVALYSEQLEKGVRTVKRYVGQDGALFEAQDEARSSFGDSAPARIQKVRVAKQTGEVFDAIRGASAEA